MSKPSANRSIPAANMTIVVCIDKRPLRWYLRYLNQYITIREIPTMSRDMVANQYINLPNCAKGETKSARDIKKEFSETIPAIITEICYEFYSLI